MNVIRAFIAIDLSPEIYNNLILNSGQVGIGAQPTCRLLLKDNIIMGNPQGIVVFLKEGHKRGKLLIRRNTFWDNGTDTENCKKASESISEGPVFHDPENGDFSLGPGPALEHKQGLTNPEIFKKLWKRWKNAIHCLPKSAFDTSTASMIWVETRSCDVWKSTSRMEPTTSQTNCRLL